MNNNLEMLWKEAIMAYLTYYTAMCHQRLSETMKIPTKDCKCPGQYFISFIIHSNFYKCDLGLVQLYITVYCNVYTKCQTVTIMK